MHSSEDSSDYSCLVIDESTDRNYDTETETEIKLDNQTSNKHQNFLDDENVSIIDRLSQIPIRIATLVNKILFLIFKIKVCCFNFAHLFLFKYKIKRENPKTHVAD